VTVRGEVLEEARALTEGERNDTYGDPYHEYTRLASMAAAATGLPLTAPDILKIMLLMKINRMASSPGHRDNYVDAAAYSAILWEVVDRGKTDNPTAL